jgi:hypothetical protein
VQQVQQERQAELAQERQAELAQEQRRQGQRPQLLWR